MLEDVFLGLDVGSTTVKVVLLDDVKNILYNRYERHYSDVRSTVIRLLNDTVKNIEAKVWHIATCGSSAISLSKEFGVSFVQEVVASTLCIHKLIPQTDVAIELGGEDAKITFFTGGIDQRMNETCAGGTGAFIDQMSGFLNTDASGLNILAKEHKTLYPIASRCGVFAKTDILPLLNDGCAKEDIAASIFQAVVDQTISGLACGREIKGKVAFLGGPLSFLSSLRERFIDSLCLNEQSAIFPEHAEYFVAMGAAFYAQENPAQSYSQDELQAKINHFAKSEGARESHSLPALFSSREEYEQFREFHSSHKVERANIIEAVGSAYLGIDSGSTTIKAALIDDKGRLLYSYYNANEGNPLAAAIHILNELYLILPEQLIIKGLVVTGYGSALLQAGLKADFDEVETIAHFQGAKFFLPKLSFILDIGGQDIKCIHIKDDTIDKIQLNEACSAGCGSFIETFAKSLGISLDEFVEAAISAQNPVDLGTRCTVFMNSKVKQAQKEGISLGDIAAGLSYSVIKNALYKVIKISSSEELGENIIAQGGSFYNMALLRALELCTKSKVVCPDISGLMGAFGAALIARERCQDQASSSILSKEELANFTAKTTVTRCQQCSNHCLLTITHFEEKRKFISGNRCEKAYGMQKNIDIPNLYNFKYNRLFDYYKNEAHLNATRIGIPRALNMYENYPIWYTILTELGYDVVLSDESSKKMYLSAHNTIPSQSICYPAKLAHGHIVDLIDKKVDVIFYPCISYELIDFQEQDNHYNCPVVTGYPEVLAKNIDLIKEKGIKFIYNFLPLNVNILAKKLKALPMFAHFDLVKLDLAVHKGFAEFEKYKQDVKREGERALEYLEKTNSYGIVLAAHPYHIDHEVHHGIAELIVSSKMAVLSEDSIAHLAREPERLRVINQWTYHSRLYRAALFVAEHKRLALLQLVSFGCGLDAVTSDQVEELLAKRNKSYTQIKIDEGANLGPAKIRIRSLIATFFENQTKKPTLEYPKAEKAFASFTEDMKATHTILIPQMSPVHFQFIEDVLIAQGYKAKLLTKVSKKAIECGLQNVHNDVCFPAITVIGQLLDAVENSGYDSHKIALIISQTGGACRATNYIAFLRKALEDNNLGYIPVISFNLSGFEHNTGFKIDYAIIKQLIMGIHYGDLLLKLTNRLRPYEQVSGSVDALEKKWAEHINQHNRNKIKLPFNKTIQAIITDFDTLPIRDIPRKAQVGLVGEILLKYHSDANNNAVSLIEQEGGEAVVSDLMDFMFYSLYDSVYRYKKLDGSFKHYFFCKLFIYILELTRIPIRRALAKSKRFNPPPKLKILQEAAKKVISLGHQTGEGWLLTAEMVELIESGANNILCMQPFGCLPNHITGKGMFKELKRIYPNANIVAIDYDPGTSEVNQLNRIKLMLSQTKKKSNSDF